MRLPVLVLAATAAAALGAGAAAAFARAPKPADLPTVEDIYQQAKTVIEGQKPGAPGAKQDSLKEAINGYRDGKLQLTDFAPLVECIKNVKETPDNRAQAANAVIERFAKVDTDKNPENRATRRAFATAVLDLMKVDKDKDEVGLGLIEKILFSMYRQKMIDFKFRASDKQSVRAQAWDKMKKYLGKGEN